MKKVLSLTLLLLVLGMEQSVFGWYSKYKNDTDYPAEVSASFKTILCPNDKNVKIAPRSIHPKTFNQGACNLNNVTARLLVELPSHLQTRAGQTKQWIQAEPYNPPYGYTGTGTHTFTVKQNPSQTGEYSFFVVRE